MLATQAGLPLDPRPYHWVARELGETPERIMERITAMLVDGRIRRIGVVPNHYRLGYVANGMSVWDVPDDLVRAVGREVGETRYRQPLLPPTAAAAGLAVQPVRHGARPQPGRGPAKVGQIAEQLGDACAASISCSARAS